MTGRIITVRDSLQKGYRYRLSEPMGKNFDLLFKPDLTPKQMLTLGVFGGACIQGCENEFPKDWFTRAKLLPHDASTPDKKLNYFGVHASQSLSEWRRKGWIREQDPRGWFQWYCRYYMGRRSEDDQRQIKRWRAMVRHVSQITGSCRSRDVFCRPKQRQAVLHWAYDARKF